MLNKILLATISKISPYTLHSTPMQRDIIEMNPRSVPGQMRKQMLTIDTSEALSLTLNGLVSLIQTLLDKGFSYVLLGQMQSDRLESEFGIYRSAAGGNYHISLDQLLNGLRLQRLKLFKRLNFEASNVHKKDTCCTEPFTEKELSCLDECFESVSNLTDVERGTVTYIAGYVTHKEFEPITKMPADMDKNYIEDCEFLNLVSRGKLSLPLECVYELSLFCYSYYKLVENKNCANKKLNAFSKIHDLGEFELENCDSVVRRLVNSFSKGQVKVLTDKFKRASSDKSTKRGSVKKTRLSSAM